MKSHSESYKEAGVDVTAGYKAVELMKASVESTFIKGVHHSIGGFGGLFEPDLSGIKTPVLVSGTDGVGTKLKLAFLMDKHDTVGQDCVAMCVNDIVCSGASPLFFLDYIACGKNYPEKIASIVKGVADGCLLSGCALIGGETAEMPGFYPEDEYDLAGFSVGMVDKSKIIDGTTVNAGDIIIGLPSSGVHSNGFSLTRKILEIDKQRVLTYIDELGSQLGEELLKPTKIYVKSILLLKEQLNILAISHITGGGFYENIPRMLPPNTMAKIERKSIDTPPIFNIIQKQGKLSEREMFNTYNMGIGMTLVVAESEADNVLKILAASGENAQIIGSVVEGNDGVEIC